MAFAPNYRTQCVLICSAKKSLSCSQVIKSPPSSVEEWKTISNHPDRQSSCHSRRIRILGVSQRAKVLVESLLTAKAPVAVIAFEDVSGVVEETSSKMLGIVRGARRESIRR